MVTFETMSQFLSRATTGGADCAAASRGASVAAVSESKPAATIVSLIRIPGAFFFQANPLAGSIAKRSPPGRPGTYRLT